MPSLVIWDERTGEILASKVPPSGSAPRPTLQNAFSGGRDLTHLRAVWIDETMTTREARENLRNRPVPKPRLDVRWERHYGEWVATLVVSVHDLMPGETLADVEATLESDELETTKVVIQPGEQVFEFEIPGTYVLRVVDSRVQPCSPCGVTIE